MKPKPTKTKANKTRTSSKARSVLSEHRRTPSAEGRRDPRGADGADGAAPALVVDRKLLLSQKLCAVVFGISSSALARWRVKPREQKGRISLYYLPDLVDYRLHRDPAAGKLNLNDERARLSAAQANRVELEVATMRGELIPADVILETWEPIVGAMRAKILALPSKIKSQIPGLKVADIAKIKTMVRGTLEDLANSGIPKRAGASRRPSP